MGRSKVYIISGTLGAGKTTVSKLLAQKMNNNALIHADIFMNTMLIEHGSLPWEKRLEFVWTNVISTAKNALKLNLDVVIEGVVEDELPQLKEAFEDYDIYYCILIADEASLEARIKVRGDHELISRSIEVLKNYQTSSERKRYIIDTSQLDPEEVLQKIAQLAPVN